MQVEMDNLQDQTHESFGRSVFFLRIVFPFSPNQPNLEIGDNVHSILRKITCFLLFASMIKIPIVRFKHLAYYRFYQFWAVFSSLFNIFLAM